MTGNRLASYQGKRYGTIRPGDRVAYQNPGLRGSGGSFLGLSRGDATVTVAEIVDFGDGLVQALVISRDDRHVVTYEVPADNLRRASCPDGATCYYGCGNDHACYRVICWKPLTGAYPDGNWPAHIKAANPADNPPDEEPEPHDHDPGHAAAEPDP